MGQAWVTNSFDFEPVPTERINVVYAFNAIAVAILIHSAIENGWKRWPPMRVLTDVGVFGTLLACGVLHADKYMDGRKVVYKDADAYLMNLTYYGIANTITQLCDNYFLYLRLVAMEKPHVCVRFLLQAYIWLVLIFPWNCFYTIVPFFVDVNRPDVHHLMEALESLTAGGYLLYNIGFVAYFTHKLCKARRAVSSLSADGAASVASAAFTKQVMVNGFKVILYCLISTAGFLLDAYEDDLGITPIGKLASLLAVNVGMHFLFNVDWETAPSRYGCTKASALMNSHSSNYKARFAERDAPTQAAGRKVKVVDDKVTLDNVLQNLMLRDCFVEYCRSCFCEESVLFLLDVIHFKSEAAKGLNGMQAYLNSAQACDHILKEYLAQGCPYEINISAGMRDRTIQRSVLYIEACKQAAKPKQTRLGRRRKSTETAAIKEGVLAESIAEPSAASVSGGNEPRRKSLSNPGGQRKSISQLVSSVVAKGSLVAVSSESPSPDAAGATTDVEAQLTPMGLSTTRRRSKVAELPAMQGGAGEGKSKALQVFQATATKLIAAHMMSTTERKRRSAEAGGDTGEPRRRSFTDAVRAVIGLSTTGGESTRQSQTASPRAPAADQSSASPRAEAGPQVGPQVGPQAGPQAGPQLASPASVEEGLGSSGSGVINSARDAPPTNQSFIPLVPPGGDPEAGLAPLLPLSTTRGSSSMPNQEFVNPIFTGTAGSASGTAKRTGGGNGTLDLGGTAMTNEDRPLGVSAGHERHSSNGSVTSIQSVTPPRSPTDLTAALDAPAVFQMAYNEVAKVLGENLLGGFKSSESYKQVTALNVGSQEAGAIMSGAVLR